MKLEGKVAVITGAAVGIGRGTAIKFANEGAKLILIDIDLEKLQLVKEEVQKITQNVEIYKCDISNEKEVDETISQGEKLFGKIDILVNNAAIWRTWTEFLDVSTEEWKKYLDVNVMGTVYMTKRVLPAMLEDKYGRIINVASVAGVYGNANMSHYSATKGAVISLTKALAKEVTDKGVLVNSVSPGSVSAPTNPDYNFYSESDLAFAGRTGTLMENANLIAFLASDDSSYISGQNIQIDGCRKKQ